MNEYYKEFKLSFFEKLKYRFFQKYYWYPSKKRNEVFLQKPSIDPVKCDSILKKSVQCGFTNSFSLFLYCYRYYLYDNQFKKMTEEVEC